MLHRASDLDGFEINTKFWLEILKERDHSKDLGRRTWEDNIKMDLRETGFGDVDWIYTAQYRDQWRALVDTVVNLLVS
jgi:hypothetical protein